MSEVKGIPFPEWDAANSIGADMVYRTSAAMQLLEVYRTASQFGRALVVAEHWSKSIALPVVRFDCERGYVLIRDNFYGLNVAVQWATAPDLDLAASPMRGVVPDDTCFLEGISSVLPAENLEPWRKSAANFAVFVDTWPNARALMRRLWAPA